MKKKINLILNKLNLNHGTKKEEHLEENKEIVERNKISSLFDKVYDVADAEEKSILETIDKENLLSIKEVLLTNYTLHNKLIKKYYSEFAYIESFVDFKNKYYVLELDSENEESLNEELKEKYALIVREHKGKTTKLVLFFPFFNFVNKIEFDEIIFISPEIVNFYFTKALALEQNENKFSFEELLKYIEEQGINDFHIRGIDENRYIFTGRIGQEVIKIGGIKPSSIIDELILQAKIMMNKDTSTIKPEDTGFVKITTLVEGITIERSFRVNIVMSNKIHSQVYSVSIRRLMTIKEIEKLGLEGLGYTDDAMKLIKKIQFRKYGISVISGKTNSGKTTLLAAILNELHKFKYNQEKRIISIENPVEIVTEYDQIDLSVTANADKDKRMTIDRAIKSILRHDPDVVLVGEVRTDEDINNYLKLALTGTNAFTTLHAGDVKTTILRLLKGADNPLDVITNLNGIIAQSLISKKCTICSGTGVYDNGKCETCSGTGKKGMLPIYEIAYFNEINPSDFINDNNQIEFAKFFDFKTLEKNHNIEYISKTQVAEYFFNQGLITKEDFLIVKESEIS